MHIPAKRMRPVVVAFFRVGWLVYRGASPRMATHNDGWRWRWLRTWEEAGLKVSRFWNRWLSGPEKVE